MATHSSILAWKIPWMKEPGMLHSGRKKSDMTERLHFVSVHTSLHLLIPNSQSIPSLPPGSLATTSLFSMSVSE